MNILHLNAFITGYIEALLFSSSATTDDGEDLEHLEGYELSADAMRRVGHDCTTFLHQYPLLIDGAVICPDYDHVQAGRDFWLTRQGHGAGFWDRGLGKVGDALSDAARAAGERYVFIDCDGLIGVE